MCFVGGGGDFEKKSSKSGPRKLFILMMEMCDMREKYTILLLFMLGTLNIQPTVKVLCTL